MIDKALEVLAGGIRDYLVRLPGLNITSEEPVHLSNVANPDGSLAMPDDTLGLSLVNIEEERTVKSQQAYVTSPEGRVEHVNPELRLNLYIVIIANYITYKTGLEFLSGVIRFFQSKNVFTPANTPEIDPAIQKLIVDMHTLDFEKLNNLWGCLGAKYLPSVMYKVRMLTIQEALAADEQPPIRKVQISERMV